MASEECRENVDIEGQAEKMFFDMGVVAYVSKQLDMATICFFEGSANALLGMVDAAGGVFGYDPGAVAWNTKQYAKIKAGYAAASRGIDPEFTSSDEIGRAGGQVATALATARYLGESGISGQAALVVTGVGGLLKVAGHFKEQHDKQGRSWSEILTDPVNMAQAVGAIAGASGLGAMAFPSLRAFLSEVGLVASAGQLGVTAGALFRLSQDKTLSADEFRDKTLQLIGDALTNVAMSADAAMAARQGGGGGGDSTGAGASAADTLPGTGITPRPPGPPRPPAPTGPSGPSPGDTLIGTGIAPRRPGPEIVRGRPGYTAEISGGQYTAGPVPPVGSVPLVRGRASPADEGEILTVYANELKSSEGKNPATAAARGNSGPYIGERNLYTGSHYKSVRGNLELDCHFESICESCTFFVTTIEFKPTLQRQRDDAASKGQVGRQKVFDGLLDRLEGAAS